MSFFENDGFQYGVLQLMSYTSFFTQIVIRNVPGRPCKITKHTLRLLKIQLAQDLFLAASELKVSYIQYFQNVSYFHSYAHPI